MITNDWKKPDFDEVYELVPGRCYIHKASTYRIAILETIIGATQWRAEIDEAMTVSVNQELRDAWCRLINMPKSVDKATSAEDALIGAVNDLANYINEAEWKAS